ncbi:MAG: TetR/AcrR family transcriptional regulator, partial [Acidimicrobiales bacterium]
MASRAEQRRSTLLALGEAAVELFESKGPSVTSGEIAARAGVSRRTLHRWCDAKEDLAFVHPLLWLDVFMAALAEQDAIDGEQPKASQRLRDASMAIARHVDGDPEPPRRAFLVAATHPELLRGFQSAYQRWVDVVAIESERAGVDPFEARVIASSVMGMVDAATRS